MKPRVHLFIHFTISLALFTSTSGLQNYESCKRFLANHYHVETRCLTNQTGYALHSCVSLMEVTGESRDNETFIWLADGNITDCLKPLDGCRCYEHNYWDLHEQDCECYNPLPPPAFPSFGSIYWRGDLIYENEERKMRTLINGEAHKLQNGAYVAKEWKQIEGNDEKEMEFEFIVPNDDDDDFIKYTGNDKSKSCKKRKISEAGSLSLMWHRSVSGKTFSLSIDVEREPGIRVQTWKLNDDGIDHTERYKWIIEHDSKKGHAFPQKYLYYFHDDIDGGSKEINLSYEYKSLPKEGVDAELRVYCDRL